MTTQLIEKASTVHDLQQLLSNYDKTLPVAVFDCDRGYASVAFKKEERIDNGKKFQWLTFYAHEKIAMYDVGTLLSYLSKLPPQAMVTKKNTNDEYTPLFLSIDGMKEGKKSYQWLVLNDELEYDRFFRPSVTTNTSSYLQQALDKMLVEMTNNTSQSIERIHQWLCQQTNQELFKGIVTDGKTLNGALAYCSTKAQETAKNEQSAMVEDDTVFQWVSDYFIRYELPKEPPKQKPKSKKKGGAEQQLELFATV